MKKLAFKTHIYIGFSVLVSLTLAGLFYELQIFEEADVADSTLDRLRQTDIILTALVFGVVCWLLLYVTKTFEHQRKTEVLIRKSNADLAKLSKDRETQSWILSGLALLDESTRGGLNEKQIGANSVRVICEYLNAKVGVIYLRNTANEHLFNHAGSYAVDAPLPYIEKGQGLTGESIAGQRQLVLSSIPDNYLTVTSTLGQSAPEHIVIQPLVYESEVIGVLEIGFFRKIDDTILQFLERAAVNLAIAAKVSIAHATLALLYEETQQQAEELEAQQEELRTTNDDLVHKTHQLEASEEELRVQQEELKQANRELEEKARLLEERNFSIEQARQSIAMKADELEQSDKYKSEFLANMSHELRTPLNSILILAKLLKDNKGGNLAPDQVKYASVIHNAGTDLLHLINNILDLSKIESGSMELVVEETLLSGIAQDLLELFDGIARSKSIEFRIILEESLPPAVTTDEQRLRQILKNLLSNAFKFTEQGGKVSLHVARGADDTLSWSVTDTGIGIPASKQQLVFEAFKQADGSTSRKFGGTGLGLSICRELATMLGGGIHVSSEEGVGSTFTLTLPLHFKGTAVTADAPQPAPSAVPTPDLSPASRPVETATSEGSAKRLLIVEDDRNFAEILEEYAHGHGFETLVAYQGDTGLQMAREHLPDAVILDIMLPVMDGWAVLKKLKKDPLTKDIPVHLMSADRPNHRKIEEAAVGFLKKPVDTQSLDEVFRQLHRILESPLKKILVVEDQKIQSDSLKSALTENGVTVQQAFTGEEALRFLETEIPVDCIILDLHLPDVSGMDLLDKIKRIPAYAEIPVIINTAMELNSEITGRILQHTKTLVVKSDKSNSRILDEVNLFINRIKNKAFSPDAVNRHLSVSAEVPTDHVLDGKRVLLADDDMRNIFALSTVFQANRMHVETASNGVEALAVLERQPDIDLVLMDIMMPEMDGYEAIAQIRANKKFTKLPVIALTAKAMQDDRRLALEAGANDYIAKPVDVDKLLSLIRVWIS